MTREVRSIDGYRLAVLTSAMSEQMLRHLNAFTDRVHDPRLMDRLAARPGQRGDHLFTLVGVTRAYEPVSVRLS